MTGILILNYNNTDDLKKCIDSVCRYCMMDKIKIVVVDNGSTIEVFDNIGNYLFKLFNQNYSKISYKENTGRLNKVTYLRLPQNVGYAKGNNEGLKLLFADSEIDDILILNSDIILTCDIITPLLSERTKYENVGAISPLLVHTNNKIDYSCARKTYSDLCLLLTFSYLFARKYYKLRKCSDMLITNPGLFNESSFEIDLPSGSCMLVAKDVFRKIGGFDENTFLYYEENILYEKFKMLNCKSYLVPKISCIHVGGSTTNSTKSSLFLKKCNYNSLIYYLKSYRKISIIKLIYLHISANIRMFKMKLNTIFP